MAWTDRQLLNRRFMSNMNQEDALVTGYFFVWFTLPQRVGKTYETLFATETTYQNEALPNNTADDLGKMLSGLTIGVPSIPDTTINQTSMVGQGGVKWGVATNIDHPTTASFKYRELSGLPVCKTIASWFSTIRDPNSGVSLLVGEDYTKTNWSGTALLGYLKPDGQTIEMATRFEGIYPLKYPSDLFTSDVASVDPLTPEIEFHVDSIWSDQDAINEAQNIVKLYNQAKPYHEPATASLYGGA